MKILLPLLALFAFSSGSPASDALRGEPQAAVEAAERPLDAEDLQALERLADALDRAEAAARRMPSY